MSLIQKLFNIKFIRHVKANPLGLAALVILFGSLLMYILLSFQTRLLADDFCAGRTLFQYGFIDAQIWWYENWSGRYSYFALIHLLIYFGGLIAPVWLSFTILSFVGSIYLLIREVGEYVYKASYDRILSLCLAAFVSIAYISSLQTIIQSLLWVTGSLTYIWPLIFFNLVLVLILRGSNPLYIFIVSLIGAGFSEAFTLSQVGISVCILFLVLLIGKDRKPVLVRLGAWILGSLLGLAVMILAPGNALREQALREAGNLVHPGVKYIAGHGLIDGAVYFFNFVSTNIFAILCMVLLGALLGATSRSRDNKYGWLALVLLISSLLSVLGISMLGQYTTGSIPVDRALAIPDYLIFISCICAGLLAHFSLRSLYSVKTKPVWIIVLCALLIIFSIPVLAHAYSESFQQFREKVYTNYTEKWDNQYQLNKGMLLKNGTSSGLGFTDGLTDITPANMNQVCDQFYNLD